MLKLAYINPNPTLGERSATPNGSHARSTLGTWCTSYLLQENPVNLLPHFTIKIYLQEPGLYKMVTRDPFHDLSCTLALEIRESKDESEFGDVICHFSAIENDYLEAFVWEDIALIDAITDQF